MPTPVGRTCPTMATFGFRTSPRAGFRIAMATGPTSPTTVGPGLVMTRGVGRLITRGAGSPTAMRGPGGRGRVTPVDSIVHSGRLLTYLSSAGAEVLVSELAMAVGVASV